MINKNMALETFKFNETLHLTNLDYKKTIDFINEVSRDYDNDIKYIFYKGLLSAITVKLEIAKQNSDCKTYK